MQPGNREPQRQKTLEAAQAEYAAHVWPGMSRARRKQVAKQVGLLKYPGAYSAANAGMQDALNTKTESNHVQPAA